jgi:hypothetical protein
MRQHGDHERHRHNPSNRSDPAHRRGQNYQASANPLTLPFLTIVLTGRVAGTACVISTTTSSARVITDCSTPNPGPITAGADEALWSPIGAAAGPGVAGITAGAVTYDTSASIYTPIRTITPGADGALRLTSRQNRTSGADCSIRRLATAGVGPNYTTTAIDDLVPSHKLLRRDRLLDWQSTKCLNPRSWRSDDSYLVSAGEAGLGHSDC